MIVSVKHYPRPGPCVASHHGQCPVHWFESFKVHRMYSLVINSGEIPCPSIELCISIKQTLAIYSVLQRWGIKGEETATCLRG